MKIAILGLGTIGYGVYDILKNPNYDIEVKKIWDKEKQQEWQHLSASSLDEIMNDDEISVVVETMGGKTYAYEAIKEALKNNKSVVTANKEVIAEYLEELTELKNKMKVSLYYEASVGGGIPLIKPLYQIKKTNTIKRIEGILNGTTNYILTKMEEGLNFSQALDEAKKNGFAEADPTNDIEGLDSKRKIAILGMIAFNKKIDLSDIYTYGISQVNKEDVSFLRKLGYHLKLLASINQTSICVEPVACRANSIFANIRDEYNALEISGDLYQKLLFYGKGAGRYPTACAIVEDLMRIKDKEINYSYHGSELMKFALPPKVYYLRLKDETKIAEEIIAYQEKNLIITKQIPWEKLDFANILFYAKIRNEDE